MNHISKSSDEPFKTYIIINIDNYPNFIKS